MLILIMALTALAVFFGIGGLLFAAGISERRLQRHEEENLASPHKAA